MDKCNFIINEIESGKMKNYNNNNKVEFKPGQVRRNTSLSYSLFG